MLKYMPKDEFERAYRNKKRYMVDTDYYYDRQLDKIIYDENSVCIVDKDNDIEKGVGYEIGRYNSKAEILWLISDFDNDNEMDKEEDAYNMILQRKQHQTKPCFIE